MTENTSGLAPMGYNVLVKPQEVAAQTKGGLYLPDEVKEREEFAQQEGILIAASPMAFSWGKWPEDRDDEKPQVGDRVFFSRYQAVEVRGRDGGKYWLMKDESIAGVMK